jgi:hypothetical protein
VLVDQKAMRAQTKNNESVQARHVPYRAPGELVKVPFYLAKVRFGWIESPLYLYYHNRLFEITVTEIPDKIFIG